MENEIRYASPESQYEGRGPVPDDTAEMAWLSLADDYDSRMKRGNLLVRQYRYREAVEAYRQAERIRRDDSMLCLRLGGALLTLFRFDEARDCYERAAALGMEAQKLAFYFGAWEYLTGRFGAAAERFREVLPCGDEEAVSAIFWHTLASIRAGREPSLLGELRPDMQPGHHRAYRRSLDFFLGACSEEDLYREASEETSDLNAAILFYALSVYAGGLGEAVRAAEYRRETLARVSVWPCVASLAARRDEGT
ncbi:MAG: hypothetical protein IK132_03560 [Clostridia bacterium]|nr:hypothetical protein [Clostridia bacterium]